MLLCYTHSTEIYMCSYTTSTTTINNPLTTRVPTTSSYNGNLYNRFNNLSKTYTGKKYKYLYKRDLRALPSNYSIEGS